MMGVVEAGGAATVGDRAIAGVGGAVGEGFTEGAGSFDDCATGSGLMTLGVVCGSFCSAGGGSLMSGRSAIGGGDS